MRTCHSFPNVAFFRFYFSDHFRDHEKWPFQTMLKNSNGIGKLQRVEFFRDDSCRDAKERHVVNHPQTSGLPHDKH